MTDHQDLLEVPVDVVNCKIAENSYSVIPRCCRGGRFQVDRHFAANVIRYTPL